MIFWLTTWKKVNSTNTHMFKNSKNVATGESIRWPIRVGNIPKWWDIHGDAKPLCLYFIKLFNVTHTHKSSTHHTYRRCLNLNNRIHKTRYATIHLRSVSTMKNSVFEKKMLTKFPFLFASSTYSQFTDINAFCECFLDTRLRLMIREIKINTHRLNRMC